MAGKRMPVQAAYRRIAVLRAIVKAERQRAESKPYEKRNGALGIVSPDTPHDRVPGEIAATFDELDAFLNHLAVAHVATAFEEVAKERLKAVIGEARKAVERAAKGGPRWPADLVRSLESFDGLAAIGAVLPLEHDDMEAFKLIRDLRNAFSHSVLASGAPSITSDDALSVLSALLDKIRIGVAAG